MVYRSNIEIIISVEVYKDHIIGKNHQKTRLVCLHHPDRKARKFRIGPKILIFLYTSKLPQNTYNFYLCIIMRLVD